MISRYGSRAKFVEAVTQRLGTDIHPRPPGWERVIEALEANPGPNNTKILAKIEKVMDALQNPKLYAEVLGTRGIWSRPARRPTSTTRC